MGGHQGRARLGTEVHIGLIDHHQGLGACDQELLDDTARHRTTGGRVGVRKDHCTRGGWHGRKLNLEVIVELQCLVRQAIEPAVTGVKAVGDVGKHQGLAVVEQPLKDKGEHLIGAIAGKDMVGRQAMQGGGSRAKRVRLRVWVEAKPIPIGPEHAANGLDHPRGRRIGIFVGVEFDEPIDLGLLTWNVGGQLPHHRAPKRVHRATVSFGL